MKTKIKLFFAIPIVGTLTLLIYILNGICSTLEFLYDFFQGLADAVENFGHKVADAVSKPNTFQEGI